MKPLINKSLIKARNFTKPVKRSSKTVQCKECFFHFRKEAIFSPPGFCFDCFIESREIPIGQKEMLINMVVFYELRYARLRKKYLMNCEKLGKSRSEVKKVFNEEVDLSSIHIHKAEGMVRLTDEHN